MARRKGTADRHDLNHTSGDGNGSLSKTPILVTPHELHAPPQYIHPEMPQCLQWLSTQILLYFFLSLHFFGVTQATGSNGSQGSHEGLTRISKIRPMETSAAVFCSPKDSGRIVSISVIRYDQSFSL